MFVAQLSLRSWCLFVRAVVSALRQARCSAFRSCEQERVVAVRSLNSCAWASVALSWPFVAAGAASVSRRVYRKRAMAEAMVDHSHSSFLLLVGAEGRSGVQKAAPGTPHKRDRQPPSFARCYGCQKNGPSSNCRPRRHGPTGRPSPLGLGEPVYLFSLRRQLRCGANFWGTAMSRYGPYC